MSDTPQASTVFDTGKAYLGALYAKAWLGATEKAGHTEAALEELESIVGDVLMPLPKLDATLCSPRVPQEAKVRMLERAFGGKVQPEVLNLLKVLTRRGRFDCLRNVLEAARLQLNGLRDRVKVLVKSAEPLDEAARELVISRLKAKLGKDVDLHTAVDPELIGGLLIRIGDTVYDGSLANQLVRLREEATQKTAQQIRNTLDRFILS